MSSATSIDKELPSKGGRHGGVKDGAGRDGAGRHGRRERRDQNDSRAFRLPAEDEPTVDPGFRIWHFFVLLSLMAATFAVILSRQSTPQHLILISVAIASAGAAAYAFYRTLAPLALPDTLGQEAIGDRLRADLEREKLLVLRSIKELEFDRAMGKLSQQDFDEMAGRLRTRAIGLMKQLDGGGYRAIIERDLAERLRRTTGAAAAPRPAPAPTAAEPVIAPVAGLCACGMQNDSDARFCKSCGAKLEAA